MPDKSKFEELIQGAGILAELSKLHYNQFLRVGFAPPVALEMTKTIVQTQMLIAAHRNKGVKNGTD